jgi:hypothetical protein
MKTIKIYTYIYALPCENHGNREKVRKELKLKLKYYFILFQSYIIFSNGFLNFNNSYIK